MHYGLRARGFLNFASHFLHIQIFQMEISTLSIIFLHANIPDKWKRYQLSLEQMRKKEKVKVKSQIRYSVACQQHKGCKHCVKCVARCYLHLWWYFYLERGNHALFDFKRMLFSGTPCMNSSSTWERERDNVFLVIIATMYIDIWQSMCDSRQCIDAKGKHSRGCKTYGTEGGYSPESSKNYSMNNLIKHNN